LEDADQTNINSGKGIRRDAGRLSVDDIFAASVKRQGLRSARFDTHTDHADWWGDRNILKYVDITE
jgi:hypothetical protein